MSNAPPPYRHRRGPLRLLDRYRRAVAAVLAALAAISAVLVLRPPPEPSAEVLVAARDLDAAAPLSEGDLTALVLADRSVPDGALSPQAVSLEDGAAGLSLNAPVRRGEVLTDARLSDPPALPYGPDLVAVPVRVADPGAVGLLSPRQPGGRAGRHGPRGVRRTALPGRTRGRGGRGPPRARGSGRGRPGRGGRGAAPHRRDPRGGQSPGRTRDHFTTICHYPRLTHDQRW